MKLKRALLLAASLCALSTASVSAQTCGGNYKVKRGDSLSLIADSQYKNAAMWTTIYQSNLDSISSPNDIRVGASYRLPCVEGLPVGLPGGTEIAAPKNAAIPRLVEQVSAPAVRRKQVDSDAPIRILAGDGYAPFSDRLLFSSGIMSDLVNRAWGSAPIAADHKFYWVNDRSAHLDPMLSEGMVDVAYPWIKPQCEADATNAICTDYIYSDAMFEMLVLLFTQKGSDFTFNSGADLAGKRLCRPRGLQLTTLVGADADWLRNNRVTIMQPDTAQECFARLVRGEADAVALNEFSGRTVINDMGLKDQVEIVLSRPLSIQSLHVVAHASNPRAGDLIAAFDQGLETLRENGEYQRTIDTHMSSIWAGF